MEIKEIEDKYNQYLAENPDITKAECIELFGRFVEECTAIQNQRRICKNCEHLSWAIGVGQGLRCINPQKEEKNKMIDNSQHTCELFEFKF